jgi:hypothetical protein
MRPTARIMIPLPDGHLGRAGGRNPLSLRHRPQADRRLPARRRPRPRTGIRIGRINAFASLPSLGRGRSDERSNYFHGTSESTLDQIGQDGLVAVSDVLLRRRPAIRALPGPSPPGLSPPHDRSAIALDERNEAATRTAIQQHALRLIGEEGHHATMEQVVEISEPGPGSVSQPGSRETIHEVGSAGA